MMPLSSPKDFPPNEASSPHIIYLKSEAPSLKIVRQWIVNEVVTLRWGAPSGNEQIDGIIITHAFSPLQKRKCSAEMPKVWVCLCDTRPEECIVYVRECFFKKNSRMLGGGEISKERKWRGFETWYGRGKKGGCLHGQSTLTFSFFPLSYSKQCQRSPLPLPHP